MQQDGSRVLRECEDEQGLYAHAPSRPTVSIVIYRVLYDRL